MEITKEDIAGFHKVCLMILEEQKNLFRFGHFGKVALAVLKYKGIGEGMDYELMEDYELEEFIKELNKEVKENDN